MSANNESRFIPSLWKNLKRVFTPSENVEGRAEICQECDPVAASNNASNFSDIGTVETVIMSDIQLDKDSKRRRLNLAIDQASVSDENSFMEIMKNLLSCSICMDVSNYSNQCSNGHLICITCSGKLQQSSGDLNCPVCRVSLKQGLHRSLLAEQLTSELPAACRHCDKVMPVKYVKKHETDECKKRMVPCQYKLFGCTWIGIEETRHEHVSDCSIATETVGTLDNVVKANMSKDFNLLQVPLQLWKSIVSKIRAQTLGSRILIRQTALNRTVSDGQCQKIFKSPMIRVPFSCCSLHGFYLDIIVLKNSETEGEKLQYILKSENRTKISLNFYIASIKVDESINLEIQDSLHCHHFESNHRESLVHEIKLISLDCDKGLPNLSDFESIFVEICMMSERERSERAHGILNSNEEDESNGFISTSGSDSNVVFTLFSPTTSSSRSMNTSNTMLPGNEDSNITNEIEPSHEEDIVITVTENVDSADDLSTENRDNYISRNNHSYVAVPSVIFNPTASIFAYSPFQLDNNFVNGNFQQPVMLAREAQYYEPDNHPVISEQEVVRLQTGNINRVTRAEDPIVTQSTRSILETSQMSLFHPSQTIVSPYISNTLSPIAIRPSLATRNILVRPRPGNNQVFIRQQIPVNIENESQIPVDNQVMGEEQLTNENRGENSDHLNSVNQSLSDSDQNDLDPQSHLTNDIVTFEELNLQDVDDEL